MHSSALLIRSVLEGTRDIKQQTPATARTHPEEERLGRSAPHNLVQGKGGPEFACHHRDGVLCGGERLGPHPLSDGRNCSRRLETSTMGTEGEAKHTGAPVGHAADMAVRRISQEWYAQAH